MKSFYFAKQKLQLLAPTIIVAGLAMSAQIHAQTITTFDAPGAGTGPFQGTSAFNISPNGTVVGFLRDPNNARHAFIRSKHGELTVFDAPGAGTGRGQGTRAYSINPGATIAGFFSDSAA